MLSVDSEELNDVGNEPNIGFLSGGFEEEKMSKEEMERLNREAIEKIQTEERLKRMQKMKEEEEASEALMK